MRNGDKPADLPATCGRCGKTIRMREDPDGLLCTAILDKVDPNFEDVCVYYVERSESSDPTNFC